MKYLISIYYELFQVSFEEVSIPVRCGHVAGKLWGGDKGGQPILALHGWQDNAGTWDPLVPLLNVKRPILAIDFPGHGLSSNIPPGLYKVTTFFINNRDVISGGIVQ